MPTLPEDKILELLKPYVEQFPALSARVQKEASRFSMYLDLLLRWNARTNLTSIREPEEIVQRHFGESVFAAGVIASPKSTGTLLDLGSGAGFPGLPIQLCLPDMRVTLAESQGKKASFLREAVRALGVPTKVWAARAEAMPPVREFDIVTLRAVDRMDVAIEAAERRVAATGILTILAGSNLEVPVAWRVMEQHAIPQSEQRFVSVLGR